MQILKNRYKNRIFTLDKELEKIQKLNIFKLKHFVEKKFIDLTLKKIKKK